MSSTPRNTSSERSAKRRSATHRVEEVLDAPLSTADIATICCASTSSGLRGYRVASMSAAQHPLGDDRHLQQVAPVLRDELADAGRAHLMSGPADPLQPAGDGSAAPRPAPRGRPRPCRSRARATTSRRCRAAARLESASSTSRRCSRASEPWCARARSSSASSFSLAASRSALRRLLTNTIVERCVRIRSSNTGWMEGQIEDRVDAAVGASSGRAEPGSCRRRNDHLEVERACARPRRPRRRRAAGRAPRSRRGTARSPPAAAASPTARSAGTGASGLGLEPLERQHQMGAALRRRDRRGSRRRSRS